MKISMFDLKIKNFFYSTNYIIESILIYKINFKILKYFHTVALSFLFKKQHVTKKKI